MPKFGDWDEKDPSTGEGFTDIFEKVREEKQSGADTVGTSHAYKDRYNQGDRYESSVSLLLILCTAAGFTKTIIIHVE